MALMLHHKAKVLIKKNMYKEALDVVGSGDSRERGEITIAVRESVLRCEQLQLFCSRYFLFRATTKLLKLLEPTDVSMMSEEAFSLCDNKLTERVDHVPMLQLDIVWCYFMLSDVSRLEVAGARLNKARLGFELSHGTDSTRFRLLQARFKQGLA
ncbi:NEDD8 ultimate buster 1 [Hordeum vulgare]|nr:NEDD8 ultimate buster 1 [Hordeum vulgare]